MVPAKSYGIPATVPCPGRSASRWMPTPCRRSPGTAGGCLPGTGTVRTAPSWTCDSRRPARQQPEPDLSMGLPSSRIDGNPSHPAPLACPRLSRCPAAHLPSVEPFPSNSLRVLYDISYSIAMFTILRSAIFDRWLSRLPAAEDGHLGDVGTVGSGVSEMRIHHGFGYRLCFITRGTELIVLLCAGDKNSQRRDIERAKRMAKEWDYAREVSGV